MTMTVHGVTLETGAKAAGSDELERPEGELERLALGVPKPRWPDHELHDEQPAALGNESGPVLDKRRRDGAGSGRAAFGREPRETVAHVHGWPGGRPALPPPATTARTRPAPG